MCRSKQRNCTKQTTSKVKRTLSLIRQKPGVSLESQFRAKLVAIVQMTISAFVMICAIDLYFDDLLDKNVSQWSRFTESGQYTLEYAVIASFVGGFFIFIIHALILYEIKMKNYRFVKYCYIISGIIIMPLFLWMMIPVYWQLWNSYL